MNRAETQFALQAFFDRLACATVADEALAKAYVDALAHYLAALTDDGQAVDIWSIEEYERVCESVHHNAQWILGASIAQEALADANRLLAAHKLFLAESGSLEAVADRPRPAYGRTPTGEVCVVGPG
jgi:trans-aconitate methyltransferase